MKKLDSVTINLKHKEVTACYSEGRCKVDCTSYPLASSEAFKIISDAYLIGGWEAKYVYSFTWLTRPIIQCPEDLMRVQELISQVKPNVIIETGVAHGGSLFFYASILNCFPGRRRVIGVDIEIRKPNAKAIEDLKDGLQLYDKEGRKIIETIEGSSIDSTAVKKVSKLINKKKDKSIMVILDACHTKEFVLKELEIYSQFITPGSYIIATDGGIMERVVGFRKSNPDWDVNNPKKAAEEFVKEHNECFQLVEPAFLFNEGLVDRWYGAWSGCIIQRMV